MTEMYADLRKTYDLAGTIMGHDSQGDFQIESQEDQENRGKLIATYTAWQEMIPDSTQNVIVNYSCRI